jgi:hypothetical protein
LTSAAALVAASAAVAVSAAPTVPTRLIVSASRHEVAIPSGNSLVESGYVDSNTAKGLFRDVAASWNVPEITPGNACTKGVFPTSSFGFAFVGVAINNQFEAGTETGCTGDTTAPPEAVLIGPKNTQGPSWNPRAGDRVSAFVDYTGGEYFLSIVDDTQKESYSYLFSCPSGTSCSRATAEVVVAGVRGCQPDPMEQTCNGDLYPMPGFGDVAFSGISDATDTTGGSLATKSYGPTEDTWIDTSSNVLAQVTSPLKNDAFIDTWKAAT